MVLIDRIRHYVAERRQRHERLRQNLIYLALPPEIQRDIAVADRRESMLRKL